VTLQPLSKSYIVNVGIIEVDKEVQIELSNQSSMRGMLYI